MSKEISHFLAKVFNSELFFALAGARGQSRETVLEEAKYLFSPLSFSDYPFLLACAKGESPSKKWLPPDLPPE